MFKLSRRSKNALEGVHPDLIAIIRLAIKLTEVDFVVTCGLRTRKEQKRLYKIGATKTMNSRHLTGHAVDLAAWFDGSVRWDWPFYDKIAIAVKEAAHQLDIDIEWGGDWSTFKDGPHFQLAREAYPDVPAC